MSEALKEGRPYDADQTQEFTEHIKKYGPVVSQHEPSATSVIEDNHFEHYPSRVDVAKTALKGLGKVFTTTGRVEIKKARAEKARQQMEVVEHLGDRISNPRQETDAREIDHLREQIGWVGTGKFETSYIPEPKPEDETKELSIDFDSMTPEEKEKARIKSARELSSKDAVTDQEMEEAISLNLMAPEERKAVLKEDARKKSAKKLSRAGKDLIYPESPPKENKPNDLRPATRYERGADKRLDKQLIKRRSAASKSRWLSKSYPQALNKDYYRLSRPEQRRMRKISKKIARLDKKAARADRKFEKIAQGKDWHGLPVKLRANAAEGKDFDKMLDDKLAAKARRQEWRKEKVEATRDDLKLAARALGEEIAERHQGSWDLTKEQAERLAAASMKVGKLAVDETVATAKFTAKGSKYTADFYAEVAQGAADIYWQLAKRLAKNAQDATKKAGSKIKPKKSSR